MKKIIVSFLAAWLTVSLAFAQADYDLIVSLYIKPKLDKIELLEAGLSAHNKKYHASGPHVASVWSVDNGKRSGQYVWGMGPCKFGDLDTQPSASGGGGLSEHDKDWNAKVAAVADEITMVEYWKTSKELSYSPANRIMGKEHGWYINVKRGQMARFNEVMKKIKKVLEAKKYPDYQDVMYNQFSDGERDVYIGSGFQKWADFDKDTFGKDFDEVHGQGAWNLALQEWYDVTVNVEHEIIIRIDRLGGRAN